MQARQTVPLLTLLLGLALTPLAMAGSALDSFSLGLEKEIGRGARRQVLADQRAARLTLVCSRARELEFTLTVVEE